MPAADIVRTVTLAAPPALVFDAVTTGTGGWLWPGEVEPREGGAAGPGAIITAWQPGRHYANRMEGEGGWFNELDFALEAGDDAPGVTRLTYRHSSVFDEGQLPGVEEHTDFYLHTLAEYVAWFPARAATFTNVDAPESSRAAGSFDRVLQALDLADGVEVGDAVVVDLPAVGPVTAGLSYRTASFVGLRTATTLVRVFGRETWGAGVSVSVHDFAAGPDSAATGTAWQGWLDDLFA
ncbi:MULTISPECIES: SRPBCC domain-containing protein [unclassified Frigoribacterium]|uniref:SRPBCC family protein n=1 Tax=unclassified Frigoribacterium TaxID=2627005 RepID=UPI0006FB1350|nr:MULTISPECIES: hypothetical protein [unclassified Frigoribacterium]KQO46410.1 hypothetical protein ASF07_01250 [Frigoribacterium sp. Leaf254]KQT38503.1 hypothetical protein ASG28_01250 [Frigoribacterium sp. Leaf415]